MERNLAKMAKYKRFTSESVTEGHPDKICDQISDGVLDAILEQDTDARVACECVASTGMVLVTGEITTNSYVDIPKIARDVIRDVGYTGSELGFDADTCAVLSAIDEQSPDIARGVDHSFEEEEELGAGDQGMVFGYACDETPELMPAPISMAHSLARRLTALRKNNVLPWLRPDGKSQVTVEYGADGQVLRCDAIVISTQHSEEISIDQLRTAIREEVVQKTIDPKLIDNNTKIYVNPTGRFVVGGPHGDSGLTGRKIIVDTYGGYAHHGGGAFSGKDPTKVDRSACYMARYIAKNLVAAGFAKQCELEIAYAIGVAKPVSILVDTFGTGSVEDELLARLVKEQFDLRPGAIIRQLDLRRPIYRQVAAYGHFGRPDLQLPWEQLDRVEELKSKL